MAQLLSELFESLSSKKEEEVTDDTVRSFIENELHILDKGTQKVIPFHFNAIQDRYWKEKSNNDYILKYRKGGFSTLTMAEYFARAVLIPNQQIVLIAHRQESTNLIFSAMHLFYNRLSLQWRQKINGKSANAQIQSRSELGFRQNESRILALTAASPDSLRGQTPTCVHMSEIAFWKPEVVEEAVSSILGSIPPDGFARMETTPSSAGTWAYDEWSRAQDRESKFLPIFYAWWDDPTNQIPGMTWDRMDMPSQDELALIDAYHLSPEQIAWRRLKMKEQRERFKREYPENSETCWLRSGSTVFDMEVVTECFGGIEPHHFTEPGLVTFSPPKPGHSYIFGVDPAGNKEKGDYSAIVALDEETGEEVFEFYDRVPLHVFAEFVHKKGMEYGEAVLSIERNNHGAAVLQYLILNNPYPFLLADLDDKLGILTTLKSKTSMISILDQYFHERSLQLRGTALFRHLASFVYNEKNQAKAAGGAHDDLVSALLLAVYGMSRMHPKSSAPILLPPEPPPPTFIPSFRIEDAVQTSVQNFFGQFIPQNEKTVFGCAHCGHPTLVLYNGVWVCGKCRKEAMTDGFYPR